MKKIIITLIVMTAIIAACKKKPGPAAPEPPAGAATFTATVFCTYTSTQSAATATATLSTTGTITAINTATGTGTDADTSTATPTLTITQTATCTGTATSTSTPLPCSCAALQAADPGAGDGFYQICPLGVTMTVFCDMTTLGGGWTLVLLNSSYPVPPQPVWNDAVNSVNMTGIYDNALSTFDLMIGVGYWNAIGGTLMMETGASRTSISHRATYSIHLDPAGNYAISLANESDIVNTGGTGSSGLYTYNNGGMLSTVDNNNDGWSENCSADCGNTAWWYKGCWQGSFWGYGGGIYGPSIAYWAGTSTEYFVYGAMWLR